MNVMSLHAGLTPRQESILGFLESEGRVSVAELAQTLQVSEVTVRKDLQDLEELSFLKRVHGGAVTAHRVKYNLSLTDKVGRQASEKALMAAAAVKLISDGDSIILDAGTSTLALARLLPGRRQGLTIITNSLPVIVELGPVADFEVIALGGTIRPHSLALIGPLTVASVSRLHADLVFMSATGIDLGRGISTANIVESETKAAMMRAGTERVVLADHTKLGIVSLAPFATWGEIDCLVTNRPLPSEFNEVLQAHSVRTLLAEDRSGVARARSESMEDELVRRSSQ
jgi:DeoR/GlpR family transcriptional regulator of sugar metabolism